MDCTSCKLLLIVAGIIIGSFIAIKVKEFIEDRIFWRKVDKMCKEHEKKHKEMLDNLWPKIEAALKESFKKDNTPPKTDENETTDKI
jgi:hypothetical protein